jgi:hypothetical protein
MRGLRRQEMNPNKISFGDNVRVLETPETTRLGIARRVGNVYGETTPSVTNVEVIGEVTDDYALNVVFEELAKDLWLAPALLEFVDHAPGSEMWVQGSPTKSVRQADGSWLEMRVKPESPSWFRRLLNRVSGVGRS